MTNRKRTRCLTITTSKTKQPKSENWYQWCHCLRLLLHFLFCTGSDSLPESWRSAGPLMRQISKERSFIWNPVQTAAVSRPPAPSHISTIHWRMTTKTVCLFPRWSILKWAHNKTPSQHVHRHFWPRERLRLHLDKRPFSPHYLSNGCWNARFPSGHLGQTPLHWQ